MDLEANRKVDVLGFHGSFLKVVQSKTKLPPQPCLLPLLMRRSFLSRRDIMILENIRDMNDIPQSYPFLAHLLGAIPRIMSHEFSANGFNCPSLGQLGPKGTCSPGSRNLKYRKITGYHMEKMR